MKKTNPFTLTFGKQPVNYISRLQQTAFISDALRSDNPLSQVFMITGVRGSGKTVIMTNIANSFKNDENWIVIDLNPERDLLQSLASKLYDYSGVKHLFKHLSFSFSLTGLSASISTERPALDEEYAIEKMLEELKKHGKHLLITIDEAVNNKGIKIFAHSFQSFIRQNFSVFLIMTGLYSNISNIENQKSLTFLHRAPKVMLNPLFGI